MVTPITLLLAFCLAISGIAGWRVWRERDRDRVDLATVILVVGITVLAGVWAATEHEVLADERRLAVAAIGLGFVAVGVGLAVRFWSE